MIKYKRMRLSRKFDKALVILTTLSMIAVVGCLAHFYSNRSYADSIEAGTFEQSEYHFVTFYNDGEKLTIKTNAKTVEDAIKRANISINSTDLVDPSLSTEINSDNFFINIYHSRPVIIKDGMIEKYIMTASYDPKTIANDAGLSIYDGDTIELIPNTNFLESGVASVYEITRNGGRTITIEEEIPFGEETVKDFNIGVGLSEVRRFGEVGRKTVTYEVFFKDNVEVKRELVSESVTAYPVSRIVAVGARTYSSTSASENESITWNFLRSQGFSAVQTAGIMGNLQQEHGFQTSDTAGGLGIAQWTGGRRNSLLNMDQPYEIMTQLNYLMQELNNGYSSTKNRILESTTIDDATRAFQNGFERCGICVEDRRINFAYSIYERYNQ